MDDDPLVRRLQVGTLTADPLPSTGTALDDLARTDSSARALLRLAALRTLARRAARRADPAPEASLPAPADPRPVASPEVAALGAYLLQTPKLAAILPELLGLLSARDLRLPYRLTPRLLTLAEGAEPPLRALAETLAGPRGTWVRDLLGPAPTAAPSDPEQLSPADRVAFVVRLRESPDPADHDRARALITDLLPRERPDQRRALVASLATNLGPPDQPILEAALGDRAASVREAVTAVLQGLPTSRVATRIRARLGAAFARDAAGTLVLTIPPLDDDWQNDGLAVTALTGLSPDLSRLVHLVRAAPPETLSDLTGWTPTELLTQLGPLANLVLRSAIVAGLAAATLRFRTASFAEPVWLAFARQPRSPTPVELLALVPAPRRHALIAWRFAKAESADPAVLPLLAALEAPWPTDVSRLVAGWIRACRSPYELTSSPLGAWLELIATRIHPDELPALLERPQFFHAMKAAMLIAEARRRIHAALPPREGHDPIPSVTSPAPNLS
jgi:hypothetical protein